MALCQLCCLLTRGQARARRKVDNEEGSGRCRSREKTQERSERGFSRLLPKARGTGWQADLGSSPSYA